MSSRRFLVAALALSLLLAGVVSAYASGHPDGLERVARAHGFAHTAGTSVTAGSPMADYPGGWAGIAGCVLVFVLVVGVTRVTGRFTRS
ncbi:PDGLE domain-containing protein [Aeromicrobium senzhongii]|uniref:PDGLE domain-containing protein n=1 Tax=Aeromicrobium senzhongii TaxID=2663859 RepID=A0ABX6SQG4_9ACTN|nr:PDGLE domain-containing protein [Aeromicrobium senzhongii]MTB89128.1 cobalt ABC transporter permease [Aeromicrobium senzhongii]QNL93603.1 PDGLE domain-containing protein [Aeromicrobium senzhongii]